LVKDREGTAEKQAGKPGFFYGYVIVASAFLILMIIFVPPDVYGVFFEPLIKEFNWSRTVISGAAALSNMAFGAFCIISARLCDRFSPRVVVGACGVLLGLGYFLMSQINSVWQLYLYFGVLIPLGMSIYVATLSIVARWFVKRRGLMTGIAFSGLSLAAVVGPPVANRLIYTYDWRLSLIILGIASIVIMVAASQFLKRDPQQVGQSPDGASVAEHSAPIASGLSLNEALRSRQFWLISALYFIFLFCTILITVHIVIHAIDLGIGPAHGANVLAIYGLVGIASVNIMGMAGDRFGSRLTSTISFSLMAISFFWLLAARETWGLYLFGFILGLSFGGMQVLFSPLVAEVFGLKAHGVILGAAALGGSVGATLGPLLGGYMFDKTGSYRLIFIICAAISVIAVALTLLVKARVRGRSNLLIAGSKH
jgi:MFS family permease